MDKHKIAHLAHLILNVKPSVGLSRLTQGLCVKCGNQAVGAFKDSLSVREYEISGLCQKCQDEIFDDSL